MKTEDKVTLQIKRLFNKACAEYGLITDGDHILVGLSGGKDSLALVQLLGERQKIFVPRFHVTAIHVSVENIGYQSDTEYLRQFCQTVGVEFLHRTTKYDEHLSTKEQFASDPTQAMLNRKEKKHCFLCSWYRRKTLFDTARELGCNKLALGHHKDDILQTLLMNMIYTGTYSTMPPRLQMQKFPLQVIRPLCLIEENMLQEYARGQGYKQVTKLCPYETESCRSDMKQLLKVLEQYNPEVKNSLWKAMHNIKQEYLC